MWEVVSALWKWGCSDVHSLPAGRIFETNTGEENLNLSQTEQHLSWNIECEVFVSFISEPYIETWFWILCIVFQCFCIPGMLALNVADQFQQYYLIRFMQIWVWVKSYSVQSRMLPFVWASYSCSITDLAFLPVKYNTFIFFTFEILVCDDCWQLFCPSIL